MATTTYDEVMRHIDAALGNNERAYRRIVNAPNEKAAGYRAQSYRGLVTRCFTWLDGRQVTAKRVAQAGRELWRGCRE